MTTRAERRAQKERNLARWVRRLRSWGIVSDKLARRYAAHGALCSCPICGNPRRHFDALTIQELKANEEARTRSKA